VTVIIATYNWSAVLPFSIATVLDQTTDDLEVWVVGDACTDDSQDVVEAIGDPRVRWHNLSVHTGHQSGPNTEGLRRARGEFVAYLGHDDLWLPRHLELLTAAVEAGAPLALGRQLRIDPGLAPFVWPPDGWQFEAGAWIAPTAAVHRRETAGRVGGWRFPDASAVDPEADLWARITEQCGPPVTIDEVTNVKLPASLRRDVYRTRPCQEQASWLARIRAARDASSFVSDACAMPPLSEASGEPSPALLGHSVSALERYRRIRRFKGLDR
jgi:glycosyltransferase involved in cell wall biosynthesis